MALDDRWKWFHAGTFWNDLMSNMISVVTPFFNEQECVKEYYRKVTGALQTLGHSYEIITVSDGSTDNTDHILKEIIERDRCVRLLRLSRNTGQWAAISAGLAAESRGMGCSHGWRPAACP